MGTLYNKCYETEISLQRIKQSEVIKEPSGKNPSPPNTERYFESPSIGLTRIGNSSLFKS